MADIEPLSYFSINSNPFGYGLYYRDIHEAEKKMEKVMLERANHVRNK